MANRKYKIRDIANLYSHGQWERIKTLSNEETDGYKLFVSNQPDGIRLNISVLRDDLPSQNGTIIAINNKFKEDILLYYLGFELMSIVGSVRLLYDAEKKKYRNRLTKQGLADFAIEIPDIESQYIYADSFYFVERLKTYLLAKKDDRYNQLRMSIFAEIMDALSLEQVMEPFFNDMNIHIYDPWKSLLEKFDRKDKQYMNKLFGELISQDSKVMNGVRKVRIAVKNISDLHKK